MDNLDNKTLLEEYRQLMESQRDNTRIAYSGTGSIFLVLCSALFLFGLITNTLASFVPAMVPGVLLCLIWLGLTEAIHRYINMRFERLEEISSQLGISPMPVTPTTPWLPFTQARTYIWLFTIVYILAWILRLILGFLI
ncbi:hypothetical protein ACFLUJ_06125 [Chloroflexota bacterium]